MHGDPLRWFRCSHSIQAGPRLAIRLVLPFAFLISNERYTFAPSRFHMHNRELFARWRPPKVGNRLIYRIENSPRSRAVERSIEQCIATIAEHCVSTHRLSARNECRRW